MANTAAELTWLTFILKDLHIPMTSPPTLYCDNLNALHMTINPVFHARSKHIELDYHFVHKDKDKKTHLPYQKHYNTKHVLDMVNNCLNWCIGEVNSMLSRHAFSIRLELVFLFSLNV